MNKIRDKMQNKNAHNFAKKKKKKKLCKKLEKTGYDLFQNSASTSTSATPRQLEDAVQEVQGAQEVLEAVL